MLVRIPKSSVQIVLVQSFQERSMSPPRNKGHLFQAHVRSENQIFPLNLLHMVSAIPFWPYSGIPSRVMPSSVNHITSFQTPLKSIWFGRKLVRSSLCLGWQGAPCLLQSRVICCTFERFSRLRPLA